MSDMEVIADSEIDRRLRALQAGPNPVCMRTDAKQLSLPSELKGVVEAIRTMGGCMFKGLSAGLRAAA
jgi:hypothetical protein